MSYCSRVYRHRNLHSHDEAAKEPFFSKKNDINKSGQSSAFFQAKLSVNEPGDKYEREADSVANAVVNNQTTSPVLQQKKISNIQRLSTSMEDEKLSTNDARMARDKEIQQKPLQQMATGPEKEKKKGIQKMNDPMKEEKDKKKMTNVQTKQDEGANSASPQVSSKIENSSGKGNPLPQKTVQEMSTTFGVDFSGVKVHNDSDAESMNKELQAQAFTHGSDIYFNQGKYNPENSEGKFLLAHELTHVVQQGGNDTVSQAKLIQRAGTCKEEPPRIPHQLLLINSVHPDVREVQRKLVVFSNNEVKAGNPALPFMPLVDDCIFGPKTFAAVLEFQKRVFPGKSVEWDGKVGDHTWTEIDKITPASPIKPPVKPPVIVPPPVSPPTVVKPGSRTPCERNCEFNFLDCINKSDNSLSCIAQRNICFISCTGSKPVFEVCARLLQPPVEISGCNHAYVETPTKRYAIITPCTSKASFALPFVDGVALKTDASPDPCGRRPTCVECIPKPGVTDLEKCFESQFKAYAGPSLHKIFGPNSNTFAGTLARGCCDNMDPQPAAFGCLPGWDDPPAPARTETCPTGPVVC